MPKSEETVGPDKTPPLPIEALRCRNCGSLDPGPREICPACHEPELARHTVPGSGLLISWTMIRRPSAAFREEKEYPVAVVNLDAGIKVTGRLQAADDRLKPGARVVAVAIHKGVPVFRGA